MGVSQEQATQPPPTESAAYSLLVALYEKDRTDKTGTIPLGKLKGILGGEEMSVSQVQTNKNKSTSSCRNCSVDAGLGLCGIRSASISPSRPK